MATAVAHKGGRHHNLIRSAKNKATGKYKKQAFKTSENKAKNVLKAKKLKTLADIRTASRREWLGGLCW